MAASIQWSESNTVSETVTDGISNLNFGSNDSVNIVPATYPVIAGENSFQKYFRIKVGSTFTEISNMLLWKSAGTYVTDESIMGDKNVAFATPAVSVVGGDVAIPTAVGSAWAIQSAAGTTTITTAGYTKYIRLQGRTLGTSPAGAVNQKTFTFQYDEV